MSREYKKAAAYDDASSECVGLCLTNEQRRIHFQPNQLDVVGFSIFIRANRPILLNLKIQNLICELLLIF